MDTSRFLRRDRILEAPQTPTLVSCREILTFSKSSLADGRSAASELSPVLFSTLSPLTMVVLTTLLTFRP